MKVVVMIMIMVVILVIKIVIIIKMIVYNMKIKMKLLPNLTRVKKLYRFDSKIFYIFFLFVLYL